MNDGIALAHLSIKIKQSFFEAFDELLLDIRVTQKIVWGDTCLKYEKKKTENVYEVHSKYSTRKEFCGMMLIASIFKITVYCVHRPVQHLQIFPKKFFWRLTQDRSPCQRNTG